MKKSIQSILLVLPILLASFALTTPVHAASTLVVGPGGGIGPCAAPTYGAISLAVTAANPGDTVIVCPGTYDETVTIDKLLTLRGEDGAVVKPTSGAIGVYVTHDDVLLQGFEVDGSGGTLQYGIYVFNANGVIVKSNTVHDLLFNPDDVSGVGILYFGWGQAINNGVIQTNTVYNTARMGIFVGGMQAGPPYYWLLSDGNIIKRNNVYQTWQGPTYDYGGAIQLNGAKNSIVEGNVVHHTQYPSTAAYYTGGIYLLGSAQGNSIFKNNVHHGTVGILIWTNPSFVVFGTDTPTSPLLQKNKLHQNTIDQLTF